VTDRELLGVGAYLRELGVALSLRACVVELILLESRGEVGHHLEVHDFPGGGVAEAGDRGDERPNDEGSPEADGAPADVAARSKRGSGGRCALTVLASCVGKRPLMADPESHNSHGGVEGAQRGETRARVSWRTRHRRDP
jgi:hypothetical protein